MVCVSWMSDSMYGYVCGGCLGSESKREGRLCKSWIHITQIIVIFIFI